MSEKLPIQFRGNQLAARILKWLGWSFQFNGLPTPRGVIVVYPHTSNWDFCIGVLAKWAMGIQVTFLAKHTLFNIPVLGAWLRYLGGMPVIRSSPQGYVDDLAQMMHAKKYAWIVITPEGTRKYTPGWRSGFYRLALKAQVPIGVAYIDYKHKQIGVTKFFMPAGDEVADLNMIREVYEGREGFHPASAAPIIFWKPPSAP
ncbi:1-acyl-sn-glycerol-3-phosphate acyltransferase [Polynucleobacter sp. MWH-Spelu-300-X4]|uniref:1-acyl-sn-glycerol-3-phosphate acyltransferase n=1 Tax=Polynucleobacter sp. MWH-Spelu-300-X4 TaxID=2689109 RepID=UPI001BFE177D|nr:1-acyl-sn-glycerol-3-phosphate acyltransferase [Polynucleobacter sp. MWH-Spelu-300-X4]QWD79117.1 1-acyl-sn-glycerol-3-phosphate acyltransferase [Polynucleobacter sp. MWH-Spelu-300-X4]